MSAAREPAGDPLAAELARWAADFRPLDRDLALDGRPLAERVVFVAGRPALVLVAAADEPRLLERALAALAFARQHAAALSEHLDLDPPVAAPRVLLVAEQAFERELLDDLRPLAGEELWLFERHSLESAGGASRFLVRVAPPQGERAAGVRAPAAPRPSAPGAELDPALERLAAELSERLERLDPGVVCAEGPAGLEWTLAGAPLCRLMVEEGRLVGRLASSEVPHRIGSAADVDVFVDWVLSLHLAGVEGRGSGRAESGPILTPEEIEAFRQ